MSEHFEGAVVEPHRIFRLYDLDAHFRNSPGAICLDHIDFTKKGYADELNSRLYRQRSEMDFVASCDCGHLADNFYIGSMCPICKSVVASPLTFGRSHLPHTTWVSIPDEIPGVLHPVFYRVLSKWLKYDRTKNYIDAILDPDVPLPPELADIVQGRGFVYFYENFDYLIEAFMNMPKKASQPYREFVTRYRKLAFVRHLPALSNVLHPITAADESAENSRRYTDKDSQYFLEAAHTLSFLRYNQRRRAKKKNVVDQKLFMAYKAYIEYLNIVTDRRLSHKPSLLRRHIFGARFHWSFRSVITPISGPHRYDELHVPWCIGVNTLRVHIIGRLVQKYRMTVSEAMAMHMRAEAQYDPIIAQIMREFIEESPFPGIVCLLNRNPSIQRGATQLFFITKFKEQIDDRAIGISVLVLKRPNADASFCRPILKRMRNGELRRMASDAVMH